MGNILKKCSMSIMILLLSSYCFAGSKKTVCVMDLEDKSGDQHSGWHDVGKGMADMLVTTLVKSNKYMVVEREKLVKAMDEQKLNATGAVTSQSAAKLGKLIGASYVITGSVTEFGVKQSKLGVGGLGRVLPFGGGVDTQTNTAKVAIDIRMIDVTTGQIIKAEKGEGEDSSTGVSIDLDIAPSVDFGKDGFDETVIGKATRKAVEMSAKTIIDYASDLPWSGRVIKVSGKQIYLNSGEEDGEQIGRVVGIYHRGEELVDPDTGASLGSEETKIGTAKIIKVEKKYSIAETTATNVTAEDYLKSEK